MLPDLARAERMFEWAAAETAVERTAGREPPPLADRGLRTLAERFVLSPVELDLMLLLLAAELRPELAPRMNRVSGRDDGLPTVAALMSILRAAHPDGDDGALVATLAPAGRMVARALIDVIGEGPFPGRMVRLPDSVWQRLVGLPVTLPFPVVPAGTSALTQLDLAPSTRAQAERAVDRGRGFPGSTLVAIGGTADNGADALAVAIAGALGLPALCVPAEAVDTPTALPALRREATWLDAALVVRGAPSHAALARLADATTGPILLVVGAVPDPDPRPIPGRRRIDIEVAELPPAQRVACWRRHLDGAAIAPGTDLDAHASRFRFGTARIAQAANRARELARARGGAVTNEDLRDSCRTGAPSLSGLARRLDGVHDLGEVIVPLATRRELELACKWARHAGTAFRSAAAGRPFRDRGGLVCLFHGPPGTGKTLAARALAGELGLDLLRVDLAQVVNKYIGETEKNLALVFDEADAAGAILFFDEADALFGKRTETRDAHDRYANIEVAFLLQRLEVHPGICVLASNLRQNVDEAFTRRIQVIAEFPMPGPDERREIWHRHLIRDALADDVDLEVIARRFAIAGGDIANAAATALVLAAAEETAVSMRHLVTGLWREFKRSGRLIGADEFGPWRQLLAAGERHR